MRSDKHNPDDEAIVRVRCEVTRTTGDSTELRDSNTIITVFKGTLGTLAGTVVKIVNNSVIVRAFVVWDAVSVISEKQDDDCDTPVAKLDMYKQRRVMMSYWEDTDVALHEITVVGVEEVAEEVARG